ncbi:hypothetical protein JL720_12827 [Aureococcus anophagefferens]|nr:hypothetical protein JL720_12827 [Aureococcus anophagefferens]
MRALVVLLAVSSLTRAWVPRTRARVDEVGDATPADDARVKELKAQLAETQFAYRRLQESVHEDAALNRRRGGAPAAHGSIPRVAFADLTDARYLEHAASGAPLIVERLPSTLRNLTLELLVRRCGSRAVTLKERQPDSPAWAEMVPVEEATLDAFARRPRRAATSTTRRWRGSAQALAAIEFAPPRLFGGRQNWFASLPVGTLHGNVSVVAVALPRPAGLVPASCGRDDFREIWVPLLDVVVEGAKRWAVSVRGDVPVLCPRKSAAASSDRFRASLLGAGTNACAGVGSAAVYFGIVEAGEFLYIPSGSPHEVLNGADDNDDRPALAVSMNYVDAASAPPLAIRRCRHAGALGLLLGRDAGASEASASPPRSRSGAPRPNSSTSSRLADPTRTPPPLGSLTRD